MPRDADMEAIAAAYSDWMWTKKGEPVGYMLPHIAARVAFFAGVEWARKQQAAKTEAVEKINANQP